MKDCAGYFRRKEMETWWQAVRLEVTNDQRGFDERSGAISTAQKIAHQVGRQSYSVRAQYCDQPCWCVQGR